MSERPPLPMELTTVVLLGEHGHVYHVPGRTYRGLAIHRPYRLVNGTAYPAPQVRGDQRWTITHAGSGLAIGSIRGGIRAAWGALCRMAQAADWTRSRDEVCRDPECRRLWRLIPVAAGRRAEDVLP